MLSITRLVARWARKVFHSETSRLLNKQHLEKAQAFYQKYGGKAIFLARFLPIVRTFAPFVAGIGKMDRVRFWMFNVSGAICWVGHLPDRRLFLWRLGANQKNFSLVTLGIIVVSVLPVIYEWYKARQEAAQQKPETN
jgi:membrane-associated protein